jgi:hypothetical protein
MSGLGIVRPHHYNFAHRIVPAIFFRDPGGFVSGLVCDGTARLRALWNRVGEELKPPDRLPSTDLSCSGVSTGAGGTLLVIRMPPPSGVPEAYYIGAWWVPAAAGVTEVARYFTLELGFDLRAGDRSTVFCEWVPGGHHNNMGEGPPPDPEAFVGRVMIEVGHGLGPAV